MIRKNSNFWLFWSAQFISGVGSTLYTAGIMVNVFQYTGSAVQTALVMVANTLPAFLTGPFAGSMVDRYDRKSVLIAMDVSRIFLVLLLLLFISEGQFNLLGLYAVVALLSVANAFYEPAKMAIIPSIVEKSELGRANSILIGTRQSALAIGFGLGGLLSLYISFEAFVFINSLSFVFSALFTRLVKTPFHKKSTEKKGDSSLLEFAMQGYRDLKDHKIGYPLVIMEILEYFPHGIWTSAILLVFVEQALDGNADDWGYLNLAYFGGMIFGSVLATFGQKIIEQKTGQIIIINAFITATMTLAFGLSPTVLVGILVCIAFGIPNAYRDVAQDTLLQSTIPQDLLGRVYAFRHMFVSVMFMIGGLFFAWVADFSEVRYIYYVGAVLYLLTGFYALGNRALRKSKIEI